MKQAEPLPQSGFVLPQHFQHFFSGHHRYPIPLLLYTTTPLPSYSGQPIPPRLWTAVLLGVWLAADDSLELVDESLPAERAAHSLVTTILALRDMVRAVWNHHTGQSCHAPIMPTPQKAPREISIVPPEFPDGRLSLDCLWMV